MKTNSSIEHAETYFRVVYLNCFAGDTKTNLSIHHAETYVGVPKIASLEARQKLSFEKKTEEEHDELLLIGKCHCVGVWRSCGVRGFPGASKLLEASALREAFGGLLVHVNPWRPPCTSQQPNKVSPHRSPTQPTRRPPPPPSLLSANAGC